MIHFMISQKKVHISHSGSVLAKISLANNILKLHSLCSIKIEEKFYENVVNCRTITTSGC